MGFSEGMQELEKKLLNSSNEKVLVTKERAEILKLSPLSLVSKIKSGDLSPVDVLHAYQAKALKESRKTNCVIEIIKDAEEHATKLEQMIKNDKESVSGMPLCGMPISIKGNVGVKGHDNTLGLEKNGGKPMPYDAVVVTILRSAGCIPFVKTNLAQMCLSIESSNPVFGAVSNPWCSTRTSGGSSGGEAALIGGGGSILGLGTDVGGSVRLPAAFCGVVGFKPTSQRVFNMGISTALPGLTGVYPTSGVLGADCKVVTLAVKKLFTDMPFYNPDTPPLPWRQDILDSTRKLRIGWYNFDGICPVTPGVRRAVKEAADKLTSLGHELVPYAVPRITEGLQLYADFVMADRGATVDKNTVGEKIDPTLEWYMDMVKIPKSEQEAVRPKIAESFGKIASNHMLGKIETGFDLWERLSDRLVYLHGVFASWRALKLDAMLCPTFAMPAPTLKNCMFTTTAGFYCMLYNLLDFPAVSVPVTRETQSDQDDLSTYETTDLLHEIVKKDAVGTIGMPLAVQLVTLPYQEELLCRLMKELENVVRYV